jgi:hypothetical protein
VANRDYTISGPDGRTLTINGPDNAAPEQLRVAAERAFGTSASANVSRETPEPSMLDSIKQGAVNLGAGAVRGAGSIGATLLAPVDYAARKIGGVDLHIPGTPEDLRFQFGDVERRKSQDDALTQLVGSDPKALMYQGGKMSGEVVGTLGVGGPLGQLIGRAAPTLGRAVASGGFVAPGAGMATRMAGGAIQGAASAGLVNPEDAGTGAVIGGAAPAVIRGAAAAGAALRGAPIKPEVAALAQRAADLGIDIPADRIANSKPMNALAAGLNYVPLSGRAATETKMAEQLDRAVSRTFGQDSPNVTQALRKARTELGGEFDRVLKATPVKFDEQLLADIGEKQQAAAKELGSDLLRPIDNQINELLAKGESGVIDGQAAYNVKRQLDRLARGNTPTAYHAEQLKGVLMDALNRSLGPEAAQGFAKTRQQYGNMLELEKLAANGAEGTTRTCRS